MPTVHNNNNFSLEGNTQSPAETWKTSQWVWWAYAHDFDEIFKDQKGIWIFFDRLLWMFQCIYT